VGAAGIGFAVVTTGAAGGFAVVTAAAGRLTDGPAAGDSKRRPVAGACCAGWAGAARPAALVAGWPPADPPTEGPWWPPCDRPPRCSSGSASAAGAVAPRSATAVRILRTRVRGIRRPPYVLSRPELTGGLGTGAAERGVLPELEAISLAGPAVVG
jgi:hypothetical protein